KLTCSAIEGEAFALEGGERIHLKNHLSTDLEAKGQRLTLSFEHGKVQASMMELERASCRENLKVAVFHGLAEVRYDRHHEYQMSFTIKITAEGEEFLTAKVWREGTREVVQELVEQELEESTEEIS